MLRPHGITHHPSGAIHSMAPTSGPSTSGTSLFGADGAGASSFSASTSGACRGAAMEVDQPSSSCTTPFGSLKRCNSAPMINQLFTDQPMTQTHLSPPDQPAPRRPEQRRVRHFSSSSISLHAAPPSTAALRLPSRLHQIKHETKQEASRETASEKEFQSTMQISQSWEELRLDESLMNVDNQIIPMSRQRSLSESVHIHPNILPGVFSPSGSPSPTRVGKQCFSPSMQAPIRNMTLTPSPSPSPTRKTFTRSLSPIAVKPSSLTLKRKLDCDDHTFNHYHSPAKKFSGHSSHPSTPDRQFLTHPLAFSISSSHLEQSSPEQSVPPGVSPLSAGFRPSSAIRPPHSNNESAASAMLQQTTDSDSAMSTGSDSGGILHNATNSAIDSTVLGGQGLLQTAPHFHFRPVVSLSSSSTPDSCLIDHPMSSSH